MCVIEWLKEEMKHGPPRRPYRQNKKIRGEIIGSMARHSAALQYQNRDETAESVIRTVHEIPIPYTMVINSAHVTLTDEEMG